jgi:DNA mismatch repair protein MutL
MSAAQGEPLTEAAPVTREAAVTQPAAAEFPAAAPPRRIQVLPPDEARKIAAGEVIDRPAALAREFLDNAIDAGSGNIELRIAAGGTRLVEVSDDGSGMEREDLELCWLTHATSKIRSLDDLKSASTLGFRGEALAAAAAVSALEIVSSVDGRGAWKLRAGPGGRPPSLEQTSRGKGSSVRSIGLFDTIPARKKFLKREGAEGAACRAVFNDKAMAFPEISFRFTQDGQLKAFFPKTPSLRERFTALALSAEEGRFLHEVSAVGEGFRALVFAGGPELWRADKRQQFVFANRRRIQDWGLTQALEYGLQGWFPNGTHPVGAIFLDIDPARADFNIHPAKREVRFADPGAIHHAVSSALRDYARRSLLGPSPQARGFGAGAAHADSAHADSVSSLALEALLAPPEARQPEAPPANIAAAGASPAAPRTASGVRLAGRVFGLFLLAERGDSLYLIDQHAAHERLLYNRFLSGPVPVQELLVPLPFETGSEDDDRFLESRREALGKLGVVLAREGGAWRVEALPEGWRLGDSETVREILGLKDAGENIAERWAATLACRSAVKDGDYLDDNAALALAEAALALPLPRCPHGRPVWVEMTREELFRAVRRA